MNIDVVSQNMLIALANIEKSLEIKNKLISEIKKLTEDHKSGSINDFQFKLKMNQLLKNKPQKVVLDSYDDKILNSLKQIRRDNIQIYKAFYKKKDKKSEKKKPLLQFKEQPSHLQRLHIDKIQLKDFITDYKNKKYRKRSEVFTVYKSKPLGKTANYFFESYSMSLTKKYKEFFKKLHNDLTISNIPILSKTYVSIILFLTLITFIVVLLLSIVLFFSNPIYLLILKSLGLALALSIGMFFLVYYYPISVAKSRMKRIQNEIPFIIIHMAAVASSGTNPTSIFKLLLDSKEYPELSGDIKKIVNYINLFGYDLSTALRAVAKTTPSRSFNELLTGMVTTIETGGNLKDFLKGKAEEALTSYKLERRRYVESLAAYSDVYTGIMIAAPLLFVVVLAIINSIGGMIGGFTVRSLAMIGTFGIMPLLNVLFLLFINLIQPE